MVSAVLQKGDPGFIHDAKGRVWVLLNKLAVSAKRGKKHRWWCLARQLLAYIRHLREIESTLYGWASGWLTQRRPEILGNR